MTKDELHGVFRDHTLTLPCFPSCEDCLAWSDDALAFAGGPNIYFLTRKVNSEHKPTWSIDSLRVGTFTNEEYTQLNPAPISDLSLGEEQLDPTVVALAWSPPGLGLHCRAVLAILTSNLLLSIWETNGSQRGWRRSCIVNHHLPIPVHNDNLKIPLTSSRRRLRIRSFAWSDPFLHKASPKWGTQFLTLVDDDSNLLFCKIGKHGRSGYGQWSITLLVTLPLEPGPASIHQDKMTSVQQVLVQHSTVRSISTGSWKISASDDTSKIEARTVISCQRFHSGLNSVLLFEATVSEDPLAIASSNGTSAVLRKLTCSESVVPVPQPAPVREGAEVSYQLDENSVWKEALQHACHNYSKKHNLDGLFRIRFRGYAVSPCHSFEAACVTLHPWDVYEYTPQANEKCHIVFRPLQASSDTRPAGTESESVVLGRLIGFVSESVASRHLKWNVVDRKLLHAYQNLALSQSSVIGGQELLNANLQSNAGNSTQMVSAHDEDMGDSPDENCTMCGSTIGMTFPITSAVCQLGHHFTRCSLSLVSIQEPGISKSCSGCNRQFLDISKLGPLRSPSLAHELFDEFDVCPYCKEKYRG